jgi:hypothetical protein
MVERNRDKQGDNASIIASNGQKSGSRRDALRSPRGIWWTVTGVISAR